MATRNVPDPTVIVPSAFQIGGSTMKREA